MLYSTRFTVVTDTKALSFFLSQTNLHYRQTRWTMFLQSYDFDIIHRPGKDNVLAEALSRIYEEREARADMILVDPTEKKAIKGPSSAMTSSVRQNLHLPHTLDPIKDCSFFPQPLLTPFLYPNIYQCGKSKMSPSQTCPRRRKRITTQVLLNKDFIRWQPPLKKVSTPCRATKPAPKDKLMTLPEPRFSFKQLRHSLLYLLQEFTALQTRWNNLYALILSPTALAEFMTPLPNWNRFPLPAQHTQLLHLVPVPILPEMIWNDFLCLQDIEPNTGHSVYGTNMNPIWKEKTATTAPLDLVISVPLAPSIPLHASLLPTTRSEDMRIDGLSLPPSPMMIDI